MWLRETVDEGDQFVAAVAAMTGELDQFVGFGDDRALFGATGDPDRAATIDDPGTHPERALLKSAVGHLESVERGTGH